jgi:hypothetical protein
VTVIATDLDGTLLRSDSTLSPRTRSALHAAREAGFRVVVATARPYRVLDRVFAGEDLVDVAILGNGSGFYDMATKQVRLTHLLDAEVLRRLMKTISAHVPGSGFAVETGHRVLYEPGYLYRPTHDDNRVRVADHDDLLSEPSVKLMVWLPERDPHASWGKLAPFISDAIECTWSSDRSPLEIAAAGVTKAAALGELCKTWGVDRADITAFGDSINDIPMMEWAGTSYAVANANPAVLDAASGRTASNDDDGVAIVIEQMVNSAAR